MFVLLLSGGIVKKSMMLYSMLLLIFCGGVLLTSCGSLQQTATAAQVKQVKAGSVRIKSIYTTDGNQNKTTIFARGDRINYYVEVYSTIDSQPSADIEFKVFATDYNKFVKSSLYSYNTTIHIENLSVGLSSFHTSVSIPGKVAPATYAIQITATSGDSAFSASSDENSFVIQPPSQLGPFNTNTITGDDGNVQGWAQLTLFQNGGYNFSGCFHNKAPNIFDYNENFVWALASASGVAYAFPYSGHTTGTWAFWGSHDDCWDTTGSSGAIAGDWVPLTQEVDHWDAKIDVDLVSLISNVVKVISLLVPIIRIILPIAAEIATA